jgi:hypothetical protein
MSDDSNITLVRDRRDPARALDAPIQQLLDLMRMLFRSVATWWRYKWKSGNIKLAKFDNPS